MSKQTPLRGRVYALQDILTRLDLDDSPSLTFVYKGYETCIQDSHITNEQLLTTDLWKTHWRYERTTHEWIPIFRAVDNDQVASLCDIEESRCPYSDAKWWVTPKGFPRKQYLND
jgi:hypothetical protein